MALAVLRSARNFRNLGLTGCDQEVIRSVAGKSVGLVSVKIESCVSVRKPLATLALPRNLEI